MRFADSNRQYEDEVEAEEAAEEDVKDDEEEEQMAGPYASATRVSNDPIGSQ